ncbi:MAG TPA: phenylalanine--tRNA ligase subunit beta [Candidatus Paceibacterota bacterium]
MLISRPWLQNFFDVTLPDAQAMADALTLHAFEIESVKGEILDVNVTANRGHDCLSHRGIAKELSAILNISFSKDPLAKKGTSELQKADNLAVSIENPILCSRYIAAYIGGIKVGPSPDWLRTDLESVGQKSINNIVDAANFVMLNIGQPMHAFDASKLTAKDGRFHIGIRNAKTNEKIETLDGKTYSLADSNLAVVDRNSNTILAIAGVKGGKSAEVDESTTDVILESANFDGIAVRKASQALKLRTDASLRFEQILSPMLAEFGMRDCIKLILKIAGGEYKESMDEYPRRQKEITISITASEVNRTLGTELKEQEIFATFTRLGFPFELNNETFAVTPPFERLDLNIPADLTEEIGRISGYQKIAEMALPTFPKAVDTNKNFYTAEHVREQLISVGYSEVYTSIFSDKGERAVINKVGGERPYLRASLLDGLTEAVEKNARNKDILGVREVKLFEIGSIWDAGKEQVVVGIAGENEEPSELPLQKYANELPTPASYENYPISKTERYRPFARFPFIVRDIALWVPDLSKSEAIGDKSQSFRVPATSEEREVEKVIKDNAGDLLVRTELFDRFEKGPKVSFAFRLVFQSSERTLTDKEANAAMENIYKAVRDRGWEVR